MIRSEPLSALLDRIKDHRSNMEGKSNPVARIVGHGTVPDFHPCRCHSLQQIEDLTNNRFNDQKDALQKIQDVIDSGEKKVILIQAPTGFGKSWVVLALAMKYGASILTSTVDLQEQYQKEFDFLTTVKGKKRYPCKQFHEQKTCDKGYCSGCKYEEQPPYNASIDPEQEEERRSDPMLKEKFIHKDKDDHQREGTGIECYYWDAKKKGELASSAVYSYASYLSPFKNNPDELPEREVLICDEAHDYDDWVTSLFQVTLDNEKAIELIDELEPDTQFTKPDEELKVAKDDAFPEIRIGNNGALQLVSDETHPELFTREEKIHHAWHFIKILIQQFEAKKDDYEECAEHTRYLLSKEHLEKHPELFCHKKDSRGKEHGFTLKPKCKGKHDPNTNHIQMVGHQKNCTEHRAYIRDDWYLDCKQHLEKGCDRDHRKYNHEHYVEMRNYISGLKTLDKTLSEVNEQGGLAVSDPEYQVTTTGPEIKIGPMKTRWITNQLLKAHKTCSVFLSSTMNKDLFCRETGVLPKFVAYFPYDSLIPVRHRRIILDKAGHRGYDNWLLNSAKLENPIVWDGIMRVIGEVLERRWEERGILMLTSYRQMDRIREMIEDKRSIVHEIFPKIINRFTFDGEGADFQETKKKHLEMHSHGNLNNPVAEPCKEIDCENENKIYATNSVFVTVKATTGVNFPYDESRFQIILKAPYIRSPVEGIDERADMIRETDPQRYWLKSAFRLVQYCGRSVRHIDDHADTYVLDGSVKYMIRHNHKHLPQWFLDAYEEGWAGEAYQID